MHAILLLSFIFIYLLLLCILFYFLCFFYCIIIPKLFYCSNGVKTDQQDNEIIPFSPSDQVFPGDGRDKTN